MKKIFIFAKKTLPISVSVISVCLCIVFYSNSVVLTRTVSELQYQLSVLDAKHSADVGVEQKKTRSLSMSKRLYAKLTACERDLDLAQKGKLGGVRKASGSGNDSDSYWKSHGAKTTYDKAQTKPDLMDDQWRQESMNSDPDYDFAMRFITQNTGSTFSADEPEAAISALKDVFYFASDADVDRKLQAVDHMFAFDGRIEDDILDETLDSVTGDLLQLNSKTNDSEASERIMSTVFDIGVYDPEHISAVADIMDGGHGRASELAAQTLLETISMLDEGDDFVQDPDLLADLRERIAKKVMENPLILEQMVDMY